MFENLTPRERSIVDALADGKNNEQIAAALAISAHTVRQHLISIFIKLNVSSRLEAVVLYYRKQLAQRDERIKDLELMTAFQAGQLEVYDKDFDNQV